MGGSQLAGGDGKGRSGNWPCGRSGTVAGTPDTVPGEGFCPGTTRGRACVLPPPSVPSTSAWSLTFGIRNGDLLYGGLGGIKWGSEDASANAWTALFAQEPTLGTM